MTSRRRFTVGTTTELESVVLTPLHLLPVLFFLLDADIRPEGQNYEWAVLRKLEDMLTRCRQTIYGPKEIFAWMLFQFNVQFNGKWALQINQ